MPPPESAPPAVTLRPARPEDAAQAAPLIHAAGPTLFNLLFGPQAADVLRLFETLFALPRNPFSHEFTVVAEQDGQVVGLALAADARARRRIGRGMFWLLPRLRGPWAMLRRLPHTLDIMSCIGTSPPGAFSLSILAVAPQQRGRGIGSLLLADVKRRAEAEGSACIVLHTEIANDAAQRLYARHGYIETARHAAKRADAHGVSGFVTMQCDLG